MSFAEGQFLRGTVAGIPLENIVELDAATASNNGQQAAQTESNPLSATVLQSLELAPGTIAITDVNGADAGVLGQFATARSNGSSMASSGTIGSNGAIGVSPADGPTAIVDLEELLGGDLTSDIADLKLSAVGIAAQAEGALKTYRGDYTLADLTLQLELPAVTSITDGVTDALGPIQSELSKLLASNGPVIKSLDSALGGLDGDLNILGVGADIDVDLDLDLEKTVENAADTVLTDDALSINLDSGVITVDLDALPSGGGLNDMAPGTEILSDAVIGDIVDGIERLLDNYLDDLETALLTAIDAADVSIDVSLTLLDKEKTGEKVTETVTTVTQVVDGVTGRVLGILDTDTGQVTSLVDGITGGLLERLLRGESTGGGLLGGLLGGLSQTLQSLLTDVTTRVVEDVDRVVTPVFETLETSVDLSIDGTLGNLQDATGATVKGTLKVLGSTIDLEADALLDPIASTLVDELLGSDGLIADVVDAVDADVLDPVLDAVAGPGSGTLDGILSDLVSVKVNVQETDTSGGQSTFTQTALRVSVLGENDVLRLDLANATVGPNAVTAVDDPEDPDNPGGDPDTADGGITPLAYTGGTLSIMAILLALLLLALGLYLASRRQAAAQVGGTDGSEDVIS